MCPNGVPIKGIRVAELGMTTDSGYDRTVIMW